MQTLGYHRDLAVRHDYVTIKWWQKYAIILIFKTRFETSYLKDCVPLRMLDKNNVLIIIWIPNDEILYVCPNRATEFTVHEM